MNLQPFFPTSAQRLNLKRLAWLLLILTLLLPQRAAEAATLVVDTTSDANLTACTSAANDCSLRGAINAANAAGGGTIIFDGTIFYFGGAIALTNDLPAVTSTIIINGPGASLVTINGSGHRVFYVDTGANLTLDGLTISNGQASYGAAIYLNQSIATVTNSVISSNLATGDGGAIYVLNGTLNLSDTTLSNNVASNSGGGIYVTPGSGFSSATLSSVTLQNNQAGTSGGGIYNAFSTVNVTDCLFTGNLTAAASGGQGGGIYTDQGIINLKNCTLTDSYSQTGSAIYNNGTYLKVINSTVTGNNGHTGVGVYSGSSGNVTITNSTFLRNAASISGGGVYNASGTMTLNNSIFSESDNGDCVRAGGTINAQNSLIRDDPSFACLNGTNSNNLSGDPKLGVYQNNGGYADTVALRDGSPAINAGDNALAVDASGNPLLYDQRGSGYDRIFGPSVDMGAYEYEYTPDFVVDRTDDANISACTTAANDCTLRGAINLANAISGTDTITFDSNVFSTARTITLGSALPNITSTMVINGPGAARVTADGANAYQVFYVDTGGNLTLDGLTIAHGHTSFGAGLYINTGGTVTVTDSTFSGNTVTGNGGAIDSLGTLTVIDSTFSGNTAATYGGGIVNNGPLTVINSTFTGNQGAYGTLTTSYDTTVTNSTFADNSVTNNYNDIVVANGTLHLNNSLVASNTGSAQCHVYSGALNAQNSLIEDGSCGITSGTNGNLTGDPSLGTLTGDPAYYPLNAGSIAINAGDNTLAVDQNGNPLTTDEAGNARIAAGTVDMGAYEAQCPAFPHTVAASDVDDLVFSIVCANANTSNDVINLTDSTYTLTAVNNSDGGQGGNALPVIASAAIAGTLTINGNGATITRDSSGGTPEFRLFYVDSRADLTLDGLTITNGSAATDGGGVYINGPTSGTNRTTMTVTNSTFSDNSAARYGGAITAYANVMLTVSNSTFSGNTAATYGGALYLYSPSDMLTVTDSTLSGNTATTTGGAIMSYGPMTISGSGLSNNTATNAAGAVYVASSSTTTVTNSTLAGNKANYSGALFNSGTLTVINSTFSGNSATTNGGAIINNSPTTMTITNSTFSGNSAANGGAINNYYGALTLNNSIVAGSTSGSDCIRSGGTINAHNSLIEDGLTCVNGTNTNNLTGDPSLGTLTGSPAYYPLNAGSPAINAGDNNLAVDADGNPLTTDEAGNPRISASIVDIGAYELVYTPDFVVDRTDDLNIATCSNAPNDCTLRGAINLANTLAGTDTITFDTTVFAPGTITLAGSSLPDVTTEMIISGTGPANIIVQASTCNPVTLPGGCTPATYRVFNVTNTGNLTLDGLTISNGDAASPYGGGLNNNGALTLTNAAFSANAGYYGGGLYNNGALTVAKSSFSANMGYYGGGIYNNGTATVANSTFSANTAVNYGGGLLNFVTLTVTNSTLSGNSAISGNGGGLSNYGALTLNNSIFAGSTGSDCYLGGGTINAQNSLIQDGLTCVNGTNTNNLTGDPSLGTLTGSPAYFPLNAGSIAINAGDNNLAVDADGNPLTTDEAGNARIFAGTVDMGAYEVGTSDCPTFPHTVAASDVTELVFSVACANANTTDDVINLTDSTYTLTAVYNSSDGSNSGLPAVLSAATSGTLTINGNGATITRDNSGGTPEFRLFYVDGLADLTLDGLTLSNGSATTNGGAIYVDGITGGSDRTMVTVSNSTFSGNSAAYGGAITAYAHVTLTVNNSTFSGNSAGTYGGAIYTNYTNDTLTVTDSTLSGNTSQFGGAILDFGVLTVSGSTLSNNTATTLGGAIYVPNTPAATVMNSTLADNTATNGGALFNAGTLTVINSTISGNSATTNGGAINNNNASTTTITNSTISGNSAANGGGINNINGILNLNNSIVAGSEGGGDCHLSGGTINAQNSLIQNGLSCINGTSTNNLTGDPDLGTLTGSPAYYPLNAGSIAINAGDNNLAVDANGNPLTTDEAGNARFYGSIVDMGAYEATYTYNFVVDRTDDNDIEGCSPSPNDCTLRGAINLANAISGTEAITFAADYTITLAGSSLPDVTTEMIISGTGAANTIVQASTCNPVTLPGGCTPANYRVFNVTNTGNLTLDSLTVQYGGLTGLNNGGGVYNRGTLTVTNSTISANAIAHYGGGIANETGSTLTVTDSTISGNSANYGAGIYVRSGSTVTISNSTLSGNTATSHGGAIYSQDTTTLSVADSIFDNNQATTGNGGAILDGGKLILSGSTLSGNSADSGGGLYTEGTETGTIINSTLYGNSAATDGGGIYKTNNNTLTVTNSTLSGNSATFSGGFYINGTFNLNNSIVTNSTNGDCSHHGSGGVINAQNSLIEGGLGCVNGTNTNNLTGDPSLGTLTGSPAYYPLNSDSIAINAGDNALAVDQNGTTLTTDEAGNPRIQQGTVDMGAYESPYNTLDTTPPVITPTTSGILGDNGWYISDVTVSWTVSDDESAITSTTGCDATTIDSDTSGATLTCEATSEGGTNSVSVTIKRDVTLPIASASVSPAANANGWNNSDVTVSFSGSDATSGIASCDADVILSSEGSGQSASGTCTDNAGNVSATATASGINIDKTAPVVGVTGVSDGATYYLGSVPTADCDTSDALSGVSSLASPTVSGGNPDGTGSFTAACDGALDNAGNSGSASVIYTVEGAPAITTQPQDTTIFSGQTATLTVVASGSSLSYQWYQGSSGDTSTPVGTDSASFTTPALTTDTSYWVRVSNPAGSVDSDTATVTVEPAPTITSQPQDTTIFSGQAATLTVTASGTGLHYQWYQGNSGDTSTLVGTDSASFTTPALTTDTSYWVRVSNPAGNADSNTATVTIEPAPTITTQPQDTTIFSGQTATLTVVASGTGLHYQWYQGNSGDTSTPVGSDSDTFTTPGLTADTSYWVRVSNPAGNADSDTATITVEPAPTITTQPQDTTIFSGQTTTLTVVASGNSLSYQWYQGTSGDTSTPVGSDSDSFTTPALTVDTSYWVRVSNPVGSADSNTATITVEPAPTITTQPQSQIIASGQTADLSVVASGSSLSYQWYQGNSGDTSTPVGSNSDSFTTPALTADTSYWVRVSNPAGNADSDTATITIGRPPAITSANSTTFVEGVADSFTITTAAGVPTSTTISASGALPGGVSFSDNGDGTATLSGTPTTGTFGTYSLTLTASNGIAPDATQDFTLNILPPTVQVTVATDPSGLSFTVDGTTYTGTQTLTWVPLSSHTLATSSPQAGTPGMQYVFDNWSDGGTLSHAVTAPATDTTYTVTFTTQYQLTTTVNPSNGGSVSPASGAYYDANTDVSLTATANSGFTFLNWTGAVANATAANTSITMSGPQSVTANFKASTSLLYNGDQLVNIGDSFNLAAQLSSPASACLSGQTIDFSLDVNPLDGSMGSYSLGSATTGSNGQATLSVSTSSWQEGIYDITASFAGSTACDPTSDDATLTAASPGNSATGGGWYPLPGSGHINFGFTVRKTDEQCKTDCAYKGQMLLINNGKWRLKGTLDSYVKTSDGQGAASGTGDLYWWDQSLNDGLGDWSLAQSGVSFTINFYDSGQKGGKGKKSTDSDTFGINIQYTPVSPPQPNSLPNSDPQPLKGGDIQVH